MCDTVDLDFESGLMLFLNALRSASDRERVLSSL